MWLDYDTKLIFNETKKLMDTVFGIDCILKPMIKYKASGKFENIILL